MQNVKNFYMSYFKKILKKRFDFILIILSHTCYVIIRRKQTHYLIDWWQKKNLHYDI